MCPTGPAPAPLTDQDGGGHSRYLPEVDGLRTFAVLSVMAYHLRAALLPGGFVGVDVFFVISGYVVSRSIWHDAARPLPAMLLRFYARRVVRILPALLVCLLACSLLTAMVVPPSWLGDATRSTARAAAIGTSNLALLGSDTYFSERSEFNVFTHTWSLAVEEQFYLVCPILLFAWHRMRRRPGVTRQAARLLVAAAAAASFVALIRTGRQDAAFYLLPGRLWELAAGALLFQAQTDRVLPDLPAAVRKAVLAAGLTAMLAACVAADPAHFPYPWAALPVMGAVLCIAAVTAGPALQSPLAALLRQPLVTAVGRLSYSLYLWHWCIDVLLRWTWGLDTAAQLVTAAVLTCAAAGLSYHLVERPMRAAAWPRLAPKWAVVLAGIAAALLTREATQQIFRARDQLTLGIVRQNGPVWYPELVKRVDGAGQCPAVTRDRRTGIQWVIEMHRVCDPPQAMRHRLFILGDSHALAYETMASRIARSADVEVRIYTAAGCPVANLLGSATPACAAFIDQAIADIGVRAQPEDVVFLASLRAVRTSEQWGPFSPAEMAARTLGPANDAGRRDGLEEATRMVTALQRIPGVHILFEAPKPVFAAPAFRCVDWFNAANPACRGGLSIARDAALRDRKPVMDAVAILQARLPGLVVWDPFDTVCPSDTCRAMTPAGPLFVDGDHLSAHANELLYPGFTALLRRFWPDAPG